MRIEIFNVGHGAAVLVVADNDNLVLFDCGHDTDGFRPSAYLPQNWRAVQQLVVSHYDSDHVSDLANLRARMPIERLLSNPSISVDEVRRLKLLEGPLSPGMAALLEMKGSFGAVQNEADLAGISIPYFYLPYGPRFADMNNLSIVAFVRYADFCAVIPGDLERAGWLALLQNNDFRQHLMAVNVFLASHHGRDTAIARRCSNTAVRTSLLFRMALSSTTPNSTATTATRGGSTSRAMAQGMC